MEERRGLERLSTRAQRFLESIGRWHPRTEEPLVRRLGTSQSASGSTIDQLLEYDELWGTLAYTWGTHNGWNYGLDGEVELVETPLGFAHNAGTDGHYTTALYRLFDGRLFYGFHQPERLRDRDVSDLSIEQRVERHALLHEKRDWLQWSAGWDGTQALPDQVERSELLQIQAASGGQHLWAESEDLAVHLAQPGWDNSAHKFDCLARTPAALAHARGLWAKCLTHDLPAGEIPA